jgi:hypothetical protein
VPLGSDKFKYKNENFSHWHTFGVKENCQVHLNLLEAKTNVTLLVTQRLRAGEKL